MFTLLIDVFREGSRDRRKTQLRSPGERHDGTKVEAAAIDVALLPTYLGVAELRL